MYKSHLTFPLFLESHADTYVTKLADKLFTNYKSHVRPFCGNNDPVTVRLDLALRQIVDLVSGCYRYNYGVLTIYFRKINKKEGDEKCSITTYSIEFMSHGLSNVFVNTC